MSARQLVQHVEHVAHRVIQDALADAAAATWERRAAMLEWARPRAGDFHGRATRAELRARYNRLTEQAEACRMRARVSLLGGDEDLDDLLGLVAEERAS